MSLHKHEIVTGEAIAILVELNNDFSPITLELSDTVTAGLVNSAGLIQSVTVDLTHEDTVLASGKIVIEFTAVQSAAFPAGPCELHVKRNGTTYTLDGFTIKRGFL